MKYRSFYICFIVVLFISKTLFSQTINIITVENEKGLHRIKDILIKDLSNIGHDVEFVAPNAPCRKADINIFIELIDSSRFCYAQKNYYIPMPECFIYSTNILKNFDKILCLTKNTQNIFSRYCPNKTEYLGFRSDDLLIADIKKEKFPIFHMCASSPFKGTGRLINCYEKYFNFPCIILNTGLFPNRNYKNLCIYDKFFPRQEIIEFMNQHLIHLCPSIAEGFGFYITEAMSLGAVVITTNAPPMNEFIKDPRFLINYCKSDKALLGKTYYFDEIDLKQKLDLILSLSLEELLQVGEKNRESFLKFTDDYKKNLVRIFSFTKELYE